MAGEFSIIKLDGWQPNLRIVKYAVQPEIIDGQGTGRMQSEGWPLYREPYGVITNLDVEFGITSSENPDFTKLYDKILSLGKKEFLSVEFILPTGKLFTQNMYASPGPIAPKRITKDGVVYVGSWAIKFIGEKAFKS